MCADLRRKGCNISRLKVHGPRTGKSAGKTFSGAKSGDYTPGSDALHFVFAVPGHEVAVVDIVFLSLNELSG